MIDLSIIIVSFNTKDVLKECIESVYKTIGSLSFEIIVVDNASKDETEKEFSKSLLPNFQYIQNKQNLGFSKANNIGIKRANGRYILFLNPDMVLHLGTLEGMVGFMDYYRDAGAATCKVILTNGKVDDSCHRGFPTPWNSFSHFSGLSKIFGKTKLFGGYNMGFLDFSKSHEIDALAGSFMLIRREAGEEVKWWDEDYFFYGEDLDFCYMLKQKGWKIYYVPEFTALHYKGVAGGIKKVSKHLTKADEETKKRATEERFKAMRIFYKKHYENKYSQLITSLVYMGISLKEKLT